MRTLPQIVLGLGLAFFSGCKSDSPSTTTGSSGTASYGEPLSTLQRFAIHAMPSSLYSTLTERKHDVISGTLSPAKGNISQEDKGEIILSLIIKTYDAFDQRIGQGIIYGTKQDAYPTAYELGLTRTVAAEERIDNLIISGQESRLLTTLSAHVSVDFCSVSRQIDNTESYQLHESQLSVERFIVRDDSQKKKQFEGAIVKSAYDKIQQEVSEIEVPSFTDYQDCLTVVRDIAHANSIDVKPYEQKIVSSGYAQLTKLTENGMTDRCFERVSAGCGIDYTRTDVCFLEALATQNGIDPTPYTQDLKNTVVASYDHAIKSGHVTANQKQEKLAVLFDISSFPCE